MVGKELRIGLFCMPDGRQVLYDRCNDGREVEEVVKMAKVVALRTVIHLLYIFTHTLMHTVLFGSDDRGMGNIEK